jgi:adenosylmethionine-8-amino-7-oxononanoate aminotransferase
MRILPSFQQRAARRADPSAADEVRSGLEPIVYALSGSEAVESAMKVALHYWDARGQRAKRGFIARQRSYHDNTLGALSLSGFLELRSPFEGSLVGVEVTSTASDYRPLDGLRGAALTDALAFLRRITESCVNGTIIVRIMK